VGDEVQDVVVLPPLAATAAAFAVAAMTPFLGVFLRPPELCGLFLPGRRRPSVGLVLATAMSLHVPSITKVSLA